MLALSWMGWNNLALNRKRWSDIIIQKTQKKNLLGSKRMRNVRIKTIDESYLVYDT